MSYFKTLVFGVRKNYATALATTTIEKTEQAPCSSVFSEYVEVTTV